MKCIIVSLILFAGLPISFLCLLDFNTTIAQDNGFQQPWQAVRKLYEQGKTKEAREAALKKLGDAAQLSQGDYNTGLEHIADALEDILDIEEIQVKYFVVLAMHVLIMDMAHDLYKAVGKKPPPSAVDFHGVKLTMEE